MNSSAEFVEGGGIYFECNLVIEEVDACCDRYCSCEDCVKALECLSALT